MGLSSNSVIHFTKSLNSLKGILANNFDIRYCRETIYSKSTMNDFLIPMVSFCDIPFSQIIKHINSYGSYGIGLKKNWAENNGLNPVLYLEKNSMLAENIFSHLYDHLTKGKKSVVDLSEKDKCMFDFVRYIKNYQGDLVRHGKKTIKNYRFSDEREWRYVLDPKIDHQIFGIIKDKSIIEDEISKGKKTLSKKIAEYKLKFTPEDTNYIIIKSESERDDLISTLEKAKGKSAYEDVKRLTSRIISTEQLLTDF